MRVKFYSSHALTNQTEIEVALKQADSKHKDTVARLAGILFAHDQYLWKLYSESQLENLLVRFSDLLELVQDNSSLLLTLSKPPTHPDRKIPHKAIDLLLARGCYMDEYKNVLPSVGWDTILPNASLPVLELLARYPAIAIHMSQFLSPAQQNALDKPLPKSYRIIEKIEKTSATFSRTPNVPSLLPEPPLQPSALTIRAAASNP